MKTRKECESVLGKELFDYVEQSLSWKNINQETIHRVLDYLALHKIAFPYINISELAERLCNNLACSISYQDMFDSLVDIFKFKRYGYATGSRIVLSTKPMRLFLSKRKFETMLDALIRHELDHIATTKHKFFDKEEYKNLLSKNLYIRQELFDEEFFSGQDISDEINKIADNTFRKRLCVCLTKTGVSGGLNSDVFGSMAFNEGITAYRMKKLDRVAGQGGVMCQSGYVLGEEIAAHFAEVIGEQRLMELQTQGAFYQIVEEYKAKTGKSGKEVRQMFELLEEHKYKSAFAKLSAQIRYGLTHEMDKKTKQTYSQIVGEKE